MLSPKTLEALNRHLNRELYSAYLYLAMSAHFETKSLSGMANWMRIQFQEELQHAYKFFDFVNERQGKVDLLAIDAPPATWDSPLQVFQQAGEHEAQVTDWINELADLAQQESDHATGTFLQWFITEQIEEESTVQTIVDRLKMVGDNSALLFMIDDQLGQRALAPAV